MTPRDITLALIVIVVWGFNFVAIHLGLADVPPLLFAAIRFSAILLALPFVPRPAVRWGDLALVGLLMYAGQFALLYSAMATGLASGMASLILQAQALFTVVIASVVLGERPTRIQLTGMAVALAGLAVVASTRSGATPLVGVLLCLGGALSWAGGNVASRRLSGTSGLAITVWGAIFVPVPLLLLSLAVDGPARMAAGLSHFGWVSLASTAYTVILASLLCYTIWNGLLGRYPAASVAPFTLLVPVVGIAAGALLLGERPGVTSLLGALLLLVGVATVVLGPRVWARRLAGRAGTAGAA